MLNNIFWKIVDVPESVHYHAQGLGLESFQDFDVANKFGNLKKKCFWYSFLLEAE
jgi:hypothetical protein